MDIYKHVGIKCALKENYSKVNHAKYTIRNISKAKFFFEFWHRDKLIKSIELKEEKSNELLGYMMIIGFTDYDILFYNSKVHSKTEIEYKELASEKVIIDEKSGKVKAIFLLRTSIVFYNKEDETTSEKKGVFHLEIEEAIIHKDFLIEIAEKAYTIGKKIGLAVSMLDIIREIIDFAREMRTCEYVLFCHKMKASYDIQINMDHVSSIKFVSELKYIQHSFFDLQRGLKIEYLHKPYFAEAVPYFKNKSRESSSISYVDPDIEEFDTLMPIIFIELLYSYFSSSTFPIPEFRTPDILSLSNFPISKFRIPDVVSMEFRFKQYDIINKKPNNILLALLQKIISKTKTTFNKIEKEFKGEFIFMKTKFSSGLKTFYIDFCIQEHCFLKIEITDISTFQPDHAVLKILFHGALLNASLIHDFLRVLMKTGIFSCPNEFYFFMKYIIFNGCCVKHSV